MRLATAGRRKGVDVGCPPAALPAPITALHGPEGELVQASDALLGLDDDVLEVARMLSDPRMIAEGPIVSPHGGAVQVTRLDGLQSTGAHWIVRTEPVAPTPMEPFHGLSDRQREVAELAANGARNHEIAAHLGIASATVKVHLRTIYETLGVGSRAELGALASELGRGGEG